MICDRCLRPSDEGQHGLYLCPLEPQASHVVWADDIPGGVDLHHGLCNADGSPRRYYSRSAIRQAAAEKGVIQWSEVYTEDRTKDARVHDDWLQSGEARRARAHRVEARAEKALQAGRR